MLNRDFFRLGLVEIKIALLFSAMGSRELPANGGSSLPTHAVFSTSNVSASNWQSSTLPDRGMVLTVRALVNIS